jgi:hypothetical protein
MVELVRAGRDPAELAREFEPTAQSISHWVAQADRQEGRREEKGNGPSAAEREELARLRRENKQLRLEGIVTGIGIERGRWAGYHEPWPSFRIAAIAFRPRSFSTRSGFISASR